MGSLPQPAFFQVCHPTHCIPAKSCPFTDHGRVKSQLFGAKPFWIKIVMKSRGAQVIHAVLE